MELTFNKEGKRFYTEFKLTKDANLHLEFKKGTSINIYQNTIDGGKYDYVEGSSEYFGDVIDIDITALVYPKMIKVVSQIEPTYAAVISDGEVTEIKAQSKEIEVTANGTTVVEPDAGFAYLNKVSVKTNVEQSGGSASTMEYLDLTGLQTMQLSYISTCAQELSLRMTMQGQEVATLGPAAQLISQASAASKICAKIDFDAPIIMIMGGTRQDSTIRDYLVSKVAELASIPRITKEEFYAL